MQRDAMVTALTLVARALAEADRDGLHELLSAAQELARAHGVYDAADLYNAACAPSNGAGTVEWSADASGEVSLMSSSDLC